MFSVYIFLFCLKGPYLIGVLLIFFNLFKNFLYIFSLLLINISILDFTPTNILFIAYISSVSVFPFNLSIIPLSYVPIVTNILYNINILFSFNVSICGGSSGGGGILII